MHALFFAIDFFIAYAVSEKFSDVLVMDSVQ